MKKLLLLALMAITSNAFAYDYDAFCEIKTNNETEQRTVGVFITDAGHGPMNYVNTEFFNILFTSSKDFLVIGVTIKETSRSMSFFGNPNDSTVGAQLIDGNNWIQVNCKNSL